MFLTKLNIAAWVLAAVTVVGNGGRPLTEALAQDPTPKTVARPAADKADVKGALTEAEFEKRHKELTRMATEGIWAIPWETTIRDGRVRAAREGKPLLVWSGLGEPLGKG